MLYEGGIIHFMKKYRFPTLTEIMKVKVGTKYVWEERVKRQSMLVHLLEEMYGIRLNLQAFSFYPNLAYFGMPLSVDEGYRQEALPLWRMITKVLEKNHWKVYSAFEHINLTKKPSDAFQSFEDVGYGYAQLLLSELVLMDLNLPSHGVGRQLELSLFQPLIGFSKKPVSRMVSGRPGSLVFTYKSDNDLLETIDKITKRKSYAKDPLYTRKCKNQVLPTIFKGKFCLNCGLNKRII